MASFTSDSTCTFISFYNGTTSKVPLPAIGHFGINSADVVINCVNQYHIVVKFRDDNFKTNQIGISGKKFHDESDQDAINRILSYKFGLNVKSGASINSYGKHSVYPDREKMIHNVYSISPKVIKTVSRDVVSGKYSSEHRVHFMICGEHDEIVKTFSDCKNSTCKHIEGIYIMNNHDISSQISEYLRNYQKNIIIANHIDKDDDPRPWVEVAKSSNVPELHTKLDARSFVYRSKLTDLLTSYEQGVLEF
jgi:hypothetical protein